MIPSQRTDGNQPPTAILTRPLCRLVIRGLVYLLTARRCGPVSSIRGNFACPYALYNASGGSPLLLLQTYIMADGPADDLINLPSRLLDQSREGVQRAQAQGRAAGSV